MRLQNLKISVSNLIDEFGQADNPLIGLAVNGLCAAIGVGVWWYFEGAIAFLGVVFAALCLAPVVAWVIHG